MTLQGPFPIVDGKNVLQAESVRALQDALPCRDYRFRDERVDDFGVDGSIELLVDGTATNIRAQIQLKARSGTKMGSDGCVSVQIDTSNLNYLLNGVCPLYVLYRPESKELRFAFARDEWNRIEHSNPAWREQESVAIHFRHLLDGEQLAMLKDRIVQDARVRREVIERVTNLRTRTGSVLVDTKSLQTTDSQQMVKMLASIGQDLTNSGLGNVVIQCATAISQREFAMAPMAALALAYAHFHLAHYYDASAVLRRLLLTKPALDASNKALLDVLFLSVRRMLGEITDEQLDHELALWRVGAPPELLIQQEIAEAWSDYREVMVPGPPSPQQVQARVRLNDALERGQRLGSGLVRHYAELQRLFLSGFEVADAHVDAEALRGIGELGFGDSHHARVIQRESQAASAQWSARLQSLLDETRGTAPQVYCEALLLRAHASLGQAMFRHFAAQTGRGASLSREETSAILAGIQEALQLARLLDSRELELSAMQFHAKWLDVFDRAEEATSLATEALKVAELCGCAIHVRQLREFLAGEDRAAARLTQLRGLDDLSEEEVLRKTDDEQLLYRAWLELEACQLPRDRLPNLVRSLQCQRRLAIERQDWCKQIALSEFRGESAVTMYADPPLLKVVCMRFGYDAFAGQVAVHRISESFRSRFCAQCSFRMPDSVVAHGGLPPEPRNQVERNRAKAARRRRRNARN